MPYLSINEAIPLLQRHVIPVSEEESISIDAASGRIVARDVVSPLDVPPFERSAMDGYAVRATDLPSSLPIVGYVAAGEAPPPLLPHHAMRVFTGAPIPPGADTVVEQEKVRAEQGMAVIERSYPVGRNISRRGSDVPHGHTLLSVGHRLTPFDIGQLASVGVTDVPVFRRPHVLLITTGNELKQPGQSLAYGQIYDANQTLFRSLFDQWGVDVTTTTVVTDDLQSVRSAFDRDLSPFDFILTTGGVSVGQFDFVIEFLKSDADLLFWHLDMHPGKAIAAARYRDRTIISLSGNPGAALTSWFLVVSPILAHLHHSPWPICEVDGTLLSDFPKPTRETRFIRVRFDYAPNGIRFDHHLSQSSDAIGSYAHADGLVRIPHGSGPLAAGAQVTGLLIPGLGRHGLAWPTF